MKRWTDLNLAALRYFVDAVDGGGLAAAAAKNFVTPPAVSQALKRLEQSLGFPLLRHQKRLFALTDEGSLFYERAKQALASFEANLSGTRAKESALSIATSATLAEFLILPALKKIPQLELKMRLGPTSQVREFVRDGSVELGLVIDDGASYGLKAEFVRAGRFELRSRTGRFEGPLIVTEDRPEVVELLKKKPVADQMMRIESWSVAHRYVETLGGTCLVPDLFGKKNLRRVSRPTTSARYEILALSKRGVLSATERKLLALLSEKLIPS